MHLQSILQPSLHCKDSPAHALSIVFFRSLPFHSFCLAIHWRHAGELRPGDVEQSAHLLQGWRAGHPIHPNFGCRVDFVSVYKRASAVFT